MRSRARPTSRRSLCATRCGSSSPRRSHSSPRRARASCASTNPLDSGVVRRFDRAVVRLLPAIPKPSSQLSRRYIAGPTLEDACRVVVRAERGREDGHDRRPRRAHRRARAGARRSSRAYDDVFDAIERNGLDSNVSVKLTALGLAIDHDLCRANTRGRRAARRGERQLRPHRHGGLATTRRRRSRIYRELRDRGLRQRRHRPPGPPPPDARDIRALADLRPNVRLCKGIYLEPPLIALPGLPRRCATTSSPRSTCCSTAARTSGSRPTTSG